jgi:hypothetical protein
MHALYLFIFPLFISRPLRESSRCLASSSSASRPPPASTSLPPPLIENLRSETTPWHFCVTSPFRNQTLSCRQDFVPVQQCKHSMFNFQEQICIIVYYCGSHFNLTDAFIACIHCIYAVGHKGKNVQFETSAVALLLYPEREAVNNNIYTSSPLFN